MIECWDDDFAEAPILSSRHRHATNTEDETLHEQLDVVRSFAQTVSSLEQELQVISAEQFESIIAGDVDDTILKAMDLVAISKQDYSDKFFDTAIGKEYLKRNETERKERLEFLRGGDFHGDSEDRDQVDVDMNTVKRLAQRAAELLPKLQKQVAFSNS